MKKIEIESNLLVADGHNVKLSHVQRDEDLDIKDMLTGFNEILEELRQFGCASSGAPLTCQVKIFEINLSDQSETELPYGKDNEAIHEQFMNRYSLPN